MKSLLAVVLFFTTSSAASWQTVNAETWQAGVAKTVITPPGPMWMSGYASRDKPADGISHDLWAKAIVLQDPAGHQVVLITLDLVGIDRQTSVEICEAVAADHKLRRDQIAISTSHTHSGPVVGNNLMAMYDFDEQNLKLIRDYTGLLRNSVVSVVNQAFADLQPGVIRYGEGQTTFAVNRRNNREADVPALRASGQLVGPVDHSVPVLAVRTPEGQLRATVFGYACHATVVSLFQWSGDWPGFAQIEIEKQHPDTIALFWAGCGADQNPLPRRTVELAEAYGRQIAASVNETLNGTMPEVQGSLKSVYREIELALDTLPSKEQIEADLKSDNIYIVRRARTLLEKLAGNGSLSQTYPYPVQMWAIGSDVDLVVLGGEVVVDYSLRIKAELGRAHTWVAGYSNDVMAYIPSARVLNEGGYEGATSMIYYGQPTVWSGDVEEHIVRTVKELYEELHSAQ